MGRTLHFTITKDNLKKFTDKEISIFESITHKYNSGEYKDAWSCESFSIDPYDFYPNWEYFKQLGKVGYKEPWDFIHNTYDKYTSEGLSRIEAIKKLSEKGFIHFHAPISHEISHFCKVQGNEYNSLLVYKALLEISKLLSETTITLHDEGEFLICSHLKIKNGKVLPELEDIKERLNHWATIAYFNSKICMVNVEKLDEHTQREINADGAYKDCCVKYLQQEIDRLQIIMAIINEHWKKNAPPFFYNVQNLDPKDWFDPEIFCRPVNIEKYRDYKCTPGTLMDGFKGEGFGLTKEDSEKTSYEMIAQMQKFLKLGSNKNLKFSILGELRNDGTLR